MLAKPPRLRWNRPPSDVSRPVVIIGIVLVSLGLGLGSAWLAAKAAAPIDSLRLGSWSTWPNAGTSKTDPYSRARLARHGELPLGAGEGLALYAREDADGAPLRSRCTYAITGQTPPARLWTLGLESFAGEPLRVGPNVTAVGSETIVRRSDGSFEITVSPAAQPGNWLTSEGAEKYRVVVRLYDTTARTLTELTDISMPEILVKGCG